jgi:hypothetical protein
MNRGDATGSSHLPARLLERYAAGTPGTGGPEAAWTVEAHLESCGMCRQVLADVVGHTDPALTTQLRQVEARLATAVRRSVQTPAVRHRAIRRVAGWARSWTAPATLPRVLMTVLVVAAAVGLDLADAASSSRFPSLVLLVAPVAPLVGVSAAWSRRLDPAYEVIATTPRAGLDLVLRRAVVVLAIVIPVLAVAGALVGVSPAGWLLPCLAFTTGALALGEVVGLREAARGLAGAWAPVVLDAVGRPAWLAALVAAAALLAARRRGYTRPVNLH